MLQGVKPKARRYNVDKKILCLALYKSAPKKYKFLSKIFCLPSPRTLTNFLFKIPFGAGINKKYLHG